MTSTGPEAPGVEGVATQVAGRVLERPPTLGRSRLVCVDGPAGSGKTTLAEALVQALGRTLAPGEVQVVHMDDLYDGWDGLTAGMDTLESSVVAPLGDGTAGHYRRYDWHAAAFGERRTVEPAAVVLVEGVGSGGRGAYDDLTTLLVWMETPCDVRLERWLGRDGEQMRAQASTWRDQEAAMFTRAGTRERADLLVDGDRLMPS